MAKLLLDLPDDLLVQILASRTSRVRFFPRRWHQEARMLQCLLGEARQDNDSDEDTNNFPFAVNDSDEEEEEEVLEDLTCEQLKQRLRAINKPVGGRKAVLIQRIRDHEEQKEALFKED